MTPQHFFVYIGKYEYCNSILNDQISIYDAEIPRDFVYEILQNRYNGVMYDD